MNNWVKPLALLLVPLLVGCDSTLLSTPRVMPRIALAGTAAAGGIISTFMGMGVAGFGEDGKAPTDTPLYQPQDLAFGPDGLVYVIDWNNHCVRRISAADRVETFAWTCSVPGDAGPPGPATKALVNHPTHLLFDRQGRLVSATWHSSRVVRINVSTGILEFVCGTGARAFAGDGGPCATAILDLPVAVAYDTAGNLIIADQANQRIRRMDTQGIVTTIVGTGFAGYSGDGGPAIKAQINNPVGQAADPAGRIAVDVQDNLLIADSGNNVIRKVTPVGIITTIIGTGTAGSAGDGGPASQAQLRGPRDLEVRPDGTLYVADTFNHCIRKVSPSGIISTVAGICGRQGFGGDGGPATEALLDRPYGIAFDQAGTLYIADTFNNRIRVVSP